MNMNKALQNLYHAVSGSTTTKVNISKLLVDIHYAITGKESENKNNWSKIINSMADNWPEGGGGGSSDFSTAQVTFYVNDGGHEYGNVPAVGPICVNEEYDVGIDVGGGGENGVTLIVPLYFGKCVWVADYAVYPNINMQNFSSSGGVTIDTENLIFVITGDGTLTYTNE